MTTMQYAIKSFESSAKNYCKDLETLSEDQILGSAGGAARRPVDFTYEVAHIQNQVAARFTGAEQPAGPTDDSWWTAPEELRSKQAISDYFKASCDNLIAICKAMSEEESEKPAGTPGRERPAHVHMNFLALHAMYHDAQINFIQSLNGDLEMHW